MVKVLNCSESHFTKMISEKKITCFGAGDELNKICRRFPGLAEKITVVADNYKSGETAAIGGKMHTIRSISEIKEVSLDTMYVISTLQYADKFIIQLDNIKLFDGIEVAVPYFIKKDISNEIRYPDGKEIIPRKIHYCWFGNSQMPQQFIQNIESWKRNCPDYEIICWNESNYDIEKNRYMSEAYKMKKWGFVPDYARLDIINTHGGIYLDTDVELLRNTDELLRFKLFCGFESPDYVAFGLGFGGCPDNAVLKGMMEEYDHISFINPDGTLNIKASPVYQTEFLRKRGLKCSGKFQMIEDTAVFPAEYFAPIDALGIGSPTSNSFSIHQYAATWFDKNMYDSKKRVVESVKYVQSRIDNVGK